MQHDYGIDNNTGRNVRLDINDVLEAIVTNNSGDLEPTTTFPYMWWADTTDDLLKMRNGTDDGWVTIGSLTDSSFGALLRSGGTMTGALLFDDGTDLANLPAAFDGDPDSGFYRVSANIWGLVGMAVELLRIDGVAGYIKLLGTKALQLTLGTTAERPTGAEGLVRANSTNKKIEAYINAGWQSLNDYTGYAAVVGSAAFCTHSTLAAALADSAVVAGSKILVTEDYTVASPISVAKNNIAIDFLPGVTYTKDTGGEPGISIANPGCRIKGGRFSGFITAIQIADNIDYNFITECRFASCTTEVDQVDDDPINVIASNITE